MAQIEPMDIDNIDSDFDNKENSFHHSNVLPRTPCTEKGYEELDVSELNMKLRYSITPASSPMSKSLTANCLDSKSFDSENYINNVVINENGNLTRSFNSTITTNETAKTLKTLPLQVLSTEQIEENRSMSVLRSNNSTFKSDDNNVTITLCGANSIDDNVSLPSTSSSVAQTPEATTPTKDILKHDGGSPIMRGIKSVLNMFRSSQSPIPTDTNDIKAEVLSPHDSELKDAEAHKPHLVTSSTPIANKNREGNGSQRNSPLKESIVFNDDLERELQWKDETTILFKEEKIPIHKLFLLQTLLSIPKTAELVQTSKIKENEILNGSVEYMDISNNDSLLENKVPINIQPTGGSDVHEVLAVESDSEFVDCETTLNNEVNISTEIRTNGNNLGEERIIENLYQQNSVIMKCNEHLLETSKQVNNNKLIADIVITPEYKHQNILSPVSEAYKNNLDKCHDNISSKNIVAKSNLEINLSETNTTECSANDQSIEASVILKETVEVSPTLNKEAVLEDDLNCEMVSLNTTKQNTVHNVTQYKEIELKSSDCTKNTTAISIAVSENIERDCSKKSEDHNVIRLPFDTPLPIDDEDADDIKNAAPQSVREHWVEDIKTVNNMNKEELAVHIKNQIHARFEHGELPINEDIYSDHVAGVSNYVLPESAQQHNIEIVVSNQLKDIENKSHTELLVDKVHDSQNIEINEVYINSENIDQNMLQKSQDKIRSECKEVQNPESEIYENHIIDGNSSNNKLTENEENKLVGNSVQIVSLGISSAEEVNVCINEKPSNTIKCKDQDIKETIIEKRAMENLTMNHIDVPTHELNYSDYHNNDIKVLIDTTENKNNSAGTNQINDEYNETTLKLDLKATILSQGNNSDHQKSIETFDHIDNVTDLLNIKQPVSTISSNIEFNQDTDKIQLFDEEQNRTSKTVFEDISNNQLIYTIENNSGNSLANSNNIVAGEECTEGQTNILVTDKISVFGSLYNVKCLKQTDNNPMHTNEMLDEKYFDNIKLDSEKTFKTVCKLTKDEELEMNTNENRHLSDIKTKEIVDKKIINALIDKQSINISNNTLIEKTNFENTKINNLVSSEEGDIEMHPQETLDTNATFNMSIGQGDQFEYKGFQIISEGCNRELDQDINIVKVESQLISNNVDQKQNETFKHSHSNIDLVSNNDVCSDKKNSQCVKDSNTIIENNTIAYDTSVIETSTRTKNDENEEKNNLISNVLDVTKEFTDENKTMCISDNLEINATQKIFHTDNITQLLNTSTLPDVQIRSKECEQGTEFTKNSGNNYLHVSLANNNIEHDNTNVELDNIIKTCAINTNISPPLSPKISSKGYNLNFDEVDDPFATKTKIRLSPPPEGTSTLLSSIEKCKPTNKNTKPTNSKKDFQRRKSQPENKKQLTIKNKINSTFSGALDISEIKKDKVNKEAAKVQEAIALDNPIANDKCQNLEDAVPGHLPQLDTLVETVNLSSLCQTEKNINSIEVFINAESHNIPGVDKTRTDAPLECDTQIEKMLHTDQIASTINAISEQPAERYEHKNVFNLPEMSSDMNFNPFTSKLRVCRSPSPSLEVKNSSTHEFKVPANDPSCLVSDSQNCDGKNAEDIHENHIVDKIEQDSSIASSVSKATEDTTVREVNTEDEDTIEGPFFETDDLNNVDKMSDVSTEHDNMMQFSDIPATQEIDDNADNGEMFIDAEAFEFLLNQNKSNVVVDSGKESLFLKFDPLFANRMSSDGVLAALNKVQKRQSTPKRISKATTIDVTYYDKLSPGPSNLNITTDINTTSETNYEDPNVTVSKPMMVVNPAVNSIITPRNKTTPPKTNRRSLTFTSPAIAVIDRLLSLSGNSSTLNHETTITQVQRDQNETDLALTQLRELLAEKEIHVHDLRSESKELKERLSLLESQVKSLEKESEQRLQKVNELNERLVEKTKINKSMAAVVEEYERTIASLIAETEQDKKRHAEERMRLTNERDEQTAHLASMEISFNDLHSKYEKSKQIILSYKANEDAYKRSIKEFEESLVKMQNNYELLKQHATSKLNHANQELERYNKAHEAEMLKLNAMIKRKELHITSLEETLAQKTKANEELTAICDELINKVG